MVSLVAMYDNHSELIARIEKIEERGTIWSVIFGQQTAGAIMQPNGVVESCTECHVSAF